MEEGIAPRGVRLRRRNRHRLGKKYRTPEEETSVRHRPEYLAAAKQLPDYRITDPGREGPAPQGLASVALRGAPWT